MEPSLFQRTGEGGAGSRLAEVEEREAERNMGLNPERNWVLDACNWERPGAKSWGELEVQE